MIGRETLITPKDRKNHNDLVAKIESGGFITPGFDMLTNLREGPVYVAHPKQNHPTRYGNTFKVACEEDSPLPVAYFEKGTCLLVNTDQSMLSHYHTKIKQIIREYMDIK